MKNMPFRNKSEQPLRIEGKYVVLHEIQPVFFEDIVRWRNNPKLNKYLNQSEELTIQSEREWYKIFIALTKRKDY